MRTWNSRNGSFSDDPEEQAEMEALKYEHLKEPILGNLYCMNKKDRFEDIKPIPNHHPQSS